MFTDGQNAEVLKQRSLRRGEGITGWVVENLRTMVNAKPELDFYGNDVSIGRMYRSAAVVPLIAEGLCIGAVTLYDGRENHFNSEDERILDLVGPQVASAMQNAKSFEESRERAMTDLLTGLPNSRYLYMQLEKEIARARRHEKPLGVVVLDLDGFKPVNDNFGHHVGDEVLRKMAEELSELFRTSDVVARWAGDEFAVLLPETDRDMVAETVQRAQEHIDALEIPISIGRTVKVGLSAGWAVYPYDGSGFEELMRVADKRMYQDKERRKSAAGNDAVRR
jgi:diguanylate cyclase (GGDEF)-like protein